MNITIINYATNEVDDAEALVDWFGGCLHISFESAKGVVVSLECEASDARELACEILELTEDQP